MLAFRAYLVLYLVFLAGYTAIVIANHGWNLMPIFFGDIAAMEWPGQFNSDFSGFLSLSALWLAWRHHFSPSGLLLAVAGFFGGMMFLVPYLLIASVQANGDTKEILLVSVR